jgi:hypothetical protein
VQRHTTVGKHPFNMLNVAKVPEGAFGVYGFWFGPRCIYVGRATDQTLRKRLVQHFKRSHSQTLTKWLLAYGPEVSFCCVVLERKHVSRSEVRLIRRLQPIGNEIMYVGNQARARSE